MFFELKGTDKIGWVSLSIIPEKSFLQAYTTHYKGFKDNFLRVKSGTRCPHVIYDLDGNRHFLIYWSDNPLYVSSFDYDKLNDLKVWSLVVLDAFRVLKVKDLLQVIDEPKKNSTFLGNRPYVIYYSNIMSLIILFTDPNFYFILNDKLKLYELGKLKAETRARRMDQSSSKSDLTGVHTQALKTNKLNIAKMASIM